MTKRPLAIITSTVAILLLATACRKDSASTPTPGGSTATDGPPVIRTTFYPLTYLTQRIAGKHAVVECPLPSDADPIFWKPTDDDIQSLQAADLIIANGTGFEKWMESVSLPASRIVDTTAWIGDQAIRYETATTHSHGKGEHSHEGLDGHTWLAPSLLKRQAESIHDALARLLPKQTADLKANHEALQADIATFAVDATAITKLLGDTPLLASHPAYNYLAREFGWRIHNLDLDPEVVPDEAPANPDKATIMLWESEPTEAVQNALPGFTHVTFSPCEAPPPAIAGDFMAIMGANLTRLEQVLVSVKKEAGAE